MDMIVTLNQGHKKTSTEMGSTLQKRNHEQVYR